MSSAALLAPDTPTATYSTLLVHKNSVIISTDKGTGWEIEKTGPTLRDGVYFVNDKELGGNDCLGRVPGNLPPLRTIYSFGRSSIGITAAGNSHNPDKELNSNDT